MKAHLAKVHVLYTKSMVWAVPCGQRVRLPEGFGATGGPALQSDLRVGSGGKLRFLGFEGPIRTQGLLSTQEVVLRAHVAKVCVLYKEKHGFGSSMWPMSTFA